MQANKIKSLKKISRELLVSLPIVSDYFLHYWVYPRASASCRQAFASYEEASQAIPSDVSIGYNMPSFYSISPEKNIKKIKFIAACNKPIEYPVLLWLKKAFANSSTVFDLGGNTGFGYYNFQERISYPLEVKWKICDLPEAVKAGNALLKHIDSPGLSYTTNTKDAEGFEIFITCGTLQYIEHPLEKILKQLTALPLHLIVHNIPLYDGKEYFTLQNLLTSYVPYKIQNYDQFLASLKALGYELIDSWEIERTCRIPFHPERFVRAYHGFYLKHKTAI